MQIPLGYGRQLAGFRALQGPAHDSDAHPPGVWFQRGYLDANICRMAVFLYPLKGFFKLQSAL
jgi:hypothetical protein